VTRGVFRLAAGGVCGLLLTGFAAGCGGEPGTGRPGPAETGPNAAGSPPAGSASPPVGPAATVSAGPSAGSVDLHRPGDLGFYATFNMDGVEGAEHFDDLDAGTAASTVVVVARVVDIVVTRTSQGEAADFPMVGVVLRPTDVVAGTLPPGSADRLTVEFVGDSTTDDERIAMLKRRLPAQPGLWFLHHKKDGAPEERGYFRTVSPQGLFVQGNQRVETPLTREGDGDMAAEGRMYRRLSALIQRVRGVR